MTEEIINDGKLTAHFHFPSSIYTIDKPEFLDAVKDVSTTYLKQMKATRDKSNVLYPTQTAGIAHEPALSNFNNFIAQAAWNILNDQGHAMQNLGTYIQEMWAQEHAQYQGHDEHVHGHGAQISGFYIIDAPESGSKIAIHDPRQGRAQINLPEESLDKITTASSTVLFVPKPGRMYFINSWLPHSVTRNTGKAPTRLVHFNLGVNRLPAKSQATVI
jgi:uncharacterized protein (TIGR02466 family)